MKFLKKKLVPCFEKKYPNYVMVLVAYNAPYHHKRHIEHLGSKTKSELVDFMVGGESILYIDLPVTTEQIEEYINCEESLSNVTDMGESFRTELNVIELKKN